MSLTTESQEALFDFLRADLEKQLTAWVDRWKEGGFWTAGNYIDSPKRMAENCPDELLGEWMRDCFGGNWSECETALSFYEQFGCDCRLDAERYALDLLDAHIEELNAA